MTSNEVGEFIGSGFGPDVSVIMIHKKRVVYLCSTYPPAPGGVARHVSDLARAMAATGFDVYVLTKHIDDAPAQEFMFGVSIKRIQVKGSKVLSSLGFLLGSFCWLLRIRPNVIHSHELHLPSLVGILAKIVLGIPLIVTIHTQGPLIGDLAVVQRARFGTLRMYMFRRFVDRFIVISQALDAEMTNANIPTAKKVVLANSVDMVRFSPADYDVKGQLRRELLLPDGLLIVVTGRLVWEKRIQNLLEIWPGVKERFTNAWLLVIGSGEYEENFRNRRIDGVNFLGEVKDVAPYLRSSDILVMTSIYEGFSLSVLEGLACGLAVVATPVGAIPELIRHKENGWIVPVDDLDALRGAIWALLEDPIMRSELGANGHTSVVRNYSLETSQERLTHLYNRLIGVEG